MTTRRQPRVGIVGAGRSRNGLGPFLARACERAGAHVVAVVGRDPERARANAAALATLLGHEVAGGTDVAALCAGGIDAVVVASPQEHHLPAIEAALAAGIACLCEKPLVARAEVPRGVAAARAFAARGLLLAENVQWPFVLPAVDALHGPPSAPARRLAMGLSPQGRGAGPMLVDALPHLLSVAQALIGEQEPFAVGAARLHVGDGGLACRLELELGHRGGRLQAELLLQHCEQQPRPAWLSIDGRRIDRRIGADYSIAFAGNGREVAVADPLQQLVQTFVDGLRCGAAAICGGPARVADRLAAYGQILSAVSV